MQKGCKSILYQGATGSGKTALTAHMLHSAASRGMRSIFIVHRRELIKQSIDAFNKEGLRHGVIGAGFFEERSHLVQIAGVQTLARRISRLAQPHLIVWDEAHHLAAQSWDNIYGRFGCFHIGLTATPERLDGKGLSKYFQALVTGPSVQTLTQQGWLSPYRYYAPSKIDVSKLHIRMGDYEKTELENTVDRPSITGNAITHYQRLCPGRRAIAFCVSIQHSQHVVEEFNRNGINAAHVDGETSVAERDAIIERFKRGDIKILSNVELFGEGFDVPGIEAAILLRATASLGYYLQQVGRALRPFEGKDFALIQDHVGNYERHGLPDDDRQWSLAGRDERTRKEGGLGTIVRLCPKCFAAQQPGADACKFCGTPFPYQPREIKEVEGELQEIQRDNIRRMRRREQGMTETLSDLIALGKARGYKSPYWWAKMVFNARQARRIGKVA